jgi:hypothetical protein
MKIIGFGDSFVWGSEIDGNTGGELAWPALAAQALGADYETFAVPGCGNDLIAQQIYSYYNDHPVDNTLAIINWTWTQRWDFYIVSNEKWITVGPTCVPQKLARVVEETQSHEIIKFYQDYASASILWNKFRSLTTIFACQQFMDLKGIKRVETFMDYHLLDRTWHCPDYVKQIQDLVKPRLSDWEGKNFVDWCHEKRFVVTEHGNHPLEDAHRAAADFWVPRYSTYFQ